MKTQVITPSDSAYIKAKLVRQVDGSEITITGVDYSTDEFTSAAHGLHTGEVIKFTETGNVAGITAGTEYFVVEGGDANTFSIAESFEDANAVSPTLVDISLRTFTMPEFQTQNLIQPASVDLSTNVFTLTAHGLSDTNRLRLENPGSVSGMSDYVYVRDKTNDTFKVALTSGGTAIDLTGGTGTMPKFHLEPQIAPTGFVVATGVFTLASHGLSNGNRLQVEVIGTVLGMLVNDYVYVINADTNTFKLSATLGGSAISFAGTNDARPKFHAALKYAVTSVDISTDKFTLTAHGLSNGNRLLIVSAGEVTGIIAGNYVFVVNKGTDDFEVSATSGGSKIDLGLPTTLPTYKKTCEFIEQRMACQILVESTGDVCALPEDAFDTDDSTVIDHGPVLFTAVPAGATLPGKYKKVFDTGTTDAIKLKALFE